jgi:hypothetical protein
MTQDEILTGRPLSGGIMRLTPGSGDLGTGTGPVTPRTLFMIPVKISADCDRESISVHPDIWASLCYSAFQLFQTVKIEKEANVNGS